MDLSFEFRKGLLFIRPKGVLNKKTSKKLSKSLEEFIYDKGVRYFVINLESLDDITKEGLEVIKEKYNDVSVHNGKLIVCGYKDEKQKKVIDEVLDDYYQIKNELNAFQLIRI